MNTSMASPLIGLVCAASIGLPFAVGIMAGYPRVGGWGAVGAFLTDMAVFQLGHRSSAPPPPAAPGRGGSVTDPGPVGDQKVQTSTTWPGWGTAPDPS